MEPVITPTPTTEESALGLIDEWLRILPTWGYTYGKVGSFTAVIYQQRVIVELSAVRYCWMPTDSHMSQSPGPVIGWLIKEMHALYREEMTRRMLMNADVEVLG